MAALASVMTSPQCFDTSLDVCSASGFLDTRWAFDELMASYRPWVLHRCRFHLGSEEDAQDVTQQVLVRVYSHMEQLKEITQFKAWLRVIVSNCCNRFLQQRARYVLGEEVETVLDKREPLVNDDLLQLERREIVSEVLTKLPDLARQVLVLRFFEDLSLAQIAESLRVTLSAAKARLYRALEQFREMVEAHSIEL